MGTGSTIKIIIEKRSDAIDICNQAIIVNLKKIGACVEVILLNNQPFRNGFLNFITEIINTLRIVFIVDKNDIVLFTDPISFNTLASICVRNKKYVVFYHYEKDPFYYKYLPFISYKEVLDKFDGIACISQFSLSQLISLGVDTKKSKVIYYGINRDLFKPTLPKKDSYNYILSVGSEEPRKNMENILKAFSILKKHFPDLKLLKVGKASQKNRLGTMRSIKELQLTDSVIFTDYVEEGELPQIYSNAKLLLFPSFLEGFGLPIMEAMACGCPVVTSDRNPMKELIGPNGETVDPSRPESIAKMCEKILSDEVYRENVITNGLSRAQYFSWDRTTAEILNFINKPID